MDAYIYQYTVGGLIFVIGMIYAVRQGYMGFSGSGLRNLVIAVGGLAFFAGFQGWLQYGSMTEAAEIPYTGEAAAEDAGKAQCAEHQEEFGGGRGEAASADRIGDDRHAEREPEHAEEGQMHQR